MLDIQKQFINYNRSSRSQSIKYIVIHSTGNTNDTAQNNHDYFAGGNRGASADFFVDDNNIIQIIDSDNYYSWAVGDGHSKYGISNSNSISIEMCGTNNGNISDKTINNTVELTQYLMNRYNIDIEHVVRHYDASRKSCPYQFQSNNWSRWYDFKERVKNGVKKGEWLKGTAEGKTDKWWYKHADGSYTKQDFEYIDGNWYYFDYEGYMITGWLHLTSTGYDYYFYSDGIMAHDCELWGTYRFDENGHATKL
jgi:N-acetylmuramoyl-L-alanine amidase CwlA